jgi:predicted acetyltransferase
MCPIISARRNNIMTDKIINAVAGALENTVDKTGLTYKQVNVSGMFAWMGLTS